MSETECTAVVDKTVYVAARLSEEREPVANIVTEMGELEKTVESIDEAIRSLRERLQAVLVPGVPEPEDDGIVPDTRSPSRSIVWRGLSDLNAHLLRLDDELNDLIDRVDM